MTALKTFRADKYNYAWIPCTGGYSRKLEDFKPFWDLGEVIFEHDYYDNRAALNVKLVKLGRKP